MNDNFDDQVRAWGAVASWIKKHWMVALSPFVAAAGLYFAGWWFTHERYQVTAQTEHVYMKVT